MSSERRKISRSSQAEHLPAREEKDNGRKALADRFPRDFWIDWIFMGLLAAIGLTLLVFFTR